MTRAFRIASLLLCSIIPASACSVAVAQLPDMSKVEIKTTSVAPGLWLLQGFGGNIAAFSGDDGLFVIDDDFAPLTDKIKAALARISKKPLRFVFNTHWHGDHTGGNESLSGSGALIVAHDNVRKRMSAQQVLDWRNTTVPPSPHAALPVVTFSQEVSFHLNGEDVFVEHLAHAHTDGDAIVWFPKANVIHTGDCFVNGRYPTIDYATGGSIDGYIAAQARLLQRADAKTKLIPGHGPLGDKAALQRSHDTLVRIRDAIAALKRAGKSLEEVVAAKPTAEWDSKHAAGSVTPDLLTTMIYRTVGSATPNAAAPKAPKGH